MEKILLGRKEKNNFTSEFNRFCKKNNTNYEHFILTTAINRIKLHNISFDNYKRFIPKNVSIKWIINLDYIDFNDDIKETSFEKLNEVKDNILKIFSEFKNIDFDFIFNKTGNFNVAVRNLTELVSKQISKNCNSILYLEDDWICNDNVENIFDLLDNYDVLDMKNKFNEKKISFQPVILRPYIWYFMFFKKLRKIKNLKIDPEKICEIKSSKIAFLKIKYKSINIFEDIGRNIDNLNNMIRGWGQKNDFNISLSYIKIDKLISSLIYIISKKDVRKLSYEVIVDSLENLIRKELFYDDIKNLLINEFKKSSNKYLFQYCKFYDRNYRKIKLDINNVYNHIDKLINTGA